MAAADSFLAERKIISVSTKRQVTIPQKFFDLLGFQNEAEFFSDSATQKSVT